ncbi:Gfo/Idh/MocA family oxidoreductase [Nocardioides sp. GY 10127]|uniref:Gfo/Idh/MocA family protein n=1 Tax=Nocardioides sp. GY 10127 TaxID=2569762 RepID=UPI0010A849CB|nr:Gfo/Idh/MocA family oxidoreductase [Nocardioides sp. GY 10127]TIC81954.1 Gfo/Idh/MocA family oxidoreductase [Nocardioides sp. GY 10127]
MDPRPAATPADPLRWGFLATGKIARTVADDLALLPEHRMVAVGSRSAESAASFAAEHAPGATAHGSYEALVADPGVEVVYVASPHAFHLEHARLALEAGKHVLVEKPVALRATDAEEMVALARERGLFLMEAMWTACHPVVLAVAARLATGELGRPRHVRGELGFRVDAEPGDRMLDPALGASALLDMGIYPLTLAHLLLGEPVGLTATADLSERGIDLDVVVTARHADGALSTSSASMTSWSDQAAAIATDRGRITFEGQFHHPSRAWFTPVPDGSDNDSTLEVAPEEIVPAEPPLGTGYTHELREVARCLAAGETESPLVPHARTLAVMRTLDEARALAGVRFPDDPAD